MKNSIKKSNPGTVMLALALLLVSFSLCAQDKWVGINEGMFPDPAFRAWLINNIPAERLRYENSEVNTYGITELDLRNSGITRLRGIGNFEQLEKLNIYGLQLRDDQLNTWGPGDYGLWSVEKTLKVLIAGNNDTAHGTEEGTGAVLTHYNLGNLPNLEEFQILDGSYKDIPDASVVYWRNTANWDKPYVHYWGGPESTWPGVAMTYISDNIWKFYVPNGATKLIFHNNGGTQTDGDGFDFAAGHIYTTDGDQGEYTDNTSYENRNIKTLSVNSENSLPASSELKKLVIRCTLVGGEISLNDDARLEYIDLYANHMITNASVITNSKSTLKYANIVGVGLFWQELNLNEASNLEYIKTTNTPISSLRLNNCTSLRTVDISDNHHLSLVTVAFCGLSDPHFLISNADTGSDPRVANSDATSSSFEVNIQDNNFTSIPDLPENITILNIGGNNLPGIEVPSKHAKLKYLYCGSNRGFPEHLVIDGTLLNVEGLDLANNDHAHVGDNYYKKVTINNAPSLKSLYFGWEHEGQKDLGNTDLEELYIHGTGITHTSNDRSIQGNNGLQIKAMENLKVLDISNGIFDCLGANYSMWNCGIEKLYASHNNFTTFTNAHHDLPGTPDNPRPHQGNDKSNLEMLTKLKVLDLSWNHLTDSVHLFRQPDLEELYLCHNREYCDPDKVEDRDPNRSSWGLRCLNLCKNVKLKKLHYSYTLIKRTQMPTHWDENKRDYGCNTMNYYDVTNTSDPNNHTNGNIFQVCCWETIEEIYADYNNMETTIIAHDYMAPGYYAISGGSRACEKLRVLSQRGTNSQTGIIGGDLYLGADIGGIKGLCRYPNIEFIDFADSDIERVFFPNLLSKLKYLDLSGNFNIDGMYAADPDSPEETKHNLTINGNFVPALHELRINNTPLLKRVDISNATNLCSIQCEQSNPEHCQVETVILHHTAIPSINNSVYSTNDHGSLDCGHVILGETKNSGMNRIGDYRNLKHLEINHNHRLDSIDLSLNTKLEYLDASHTSLGLGNSVTIDGVTRRSSGLNLSGLNALKTVKANYARLRTINHCNSLPNSIETLELDGNFKLQFLNLQGNTALKRLTVNNCNLFSLDLSDCTSLEYLDCSNCLTNAVNNQCEYGSADTSLPPCLVINPETGKAVAAEGCNDENTTPTGDFWNAIPELHICSPNIKTVYAGRGNLHKITFTDDALRSIQILDIHNNHINALQDMSSATNLTNFQDHNNGRTIEAESNFFFDIRDEQGIFDLYWYFFFQHDKSANGEGAWEGHHYVGNRTSTNELAFAHVENHDHGDPYSDEIVAVEKDYEGYERVLGSSDGLSGDLFDSAKVLAWTEGTRNNASAHGPRKVLMVANPVDLPSDHIKGDMTLLNPENFDVYGKANGHAEYTYDNKLPASLNHTSTYYLDWTVTQPPTLTGIDDVTAPTSKPITSVRYYDVNGMESETPFEGVNVVVTSYSDGTVKVTKEKF